MYFAGHSVAGVLFLGLLWIHMGLGERSAVTLSRHRRYLIYPDGDPARVQLIIGVGLPVDLDDEAVTVGYVIKMLFHIPQNSTDYTSAWYNSGPIVGRSHSRTHRSNEDNEISREGPAKADNGPNESEFEENEKNKADSEPIGEVPAPPLTRWDIYKMLEHMLQNNGMGGRECILRTICEAAETPFTYHNGLFGELVHILFTPSTSLDELSHHTDNEFHAAERIGLDPDADCSNMFSECDQSFLEMFSEVMIPSILGTKTDFM